MVVNNQDTVDKLETRLGEFDHLFQEGVVFTNHERHKIKQFAQEILSICNDKMFRTDEGNDNKPIITRKVKLLAKVEALKTSIHDECGSYQQELIDEIYSLTK